MALVRANTSGSGGGHHFSAFSFEYGSTALQHISLDFKPKYIAVFFQGSSGSTSSNNKGCERWIYDEDYSNSYSYGAEQGSGGTNYIKTVSVNNLVSSTGITNIDNTGFDFSGDNTNSVFRGTYHGFAAD